MSKITNILKSKIESIAKNLIKKKEGTNNYLKKNKFKEESKENNLNISSNTLKDSLSCLEEFKDSFCKYNNNNGIKKIETNYLRNNQNNNDLHKLNQHSSICSKGTLSSENKNSIIESFQKVKINDKNILDSKIKKDEIEIRNILINKINTAQIKEIQDFYEQLIEIYNNVNCNEINNITDFINKSAILSFHYIKNLLSEDMEIFIKLFYNSIEINKFLLSQIYLFLSLIYLINEKLNDYLMLSYKTLLFYSSQNFANISKIISEQKLFNDEKTHNNILSVNKIIFSILKTVTDIPSNSQIIYYITPIQYNIEKNGNNIEIELENRKSGISNLLILLKENKKLNEKLLEIEKAEQKMIEESKNVKNNKIEEIIIYKNKKKESEYIEIEKILPEMDTNKYKYTLLFELDETIVHYCEENDNYFVEVRFGTDELIEYIHKFCEIIIVSTSEIEYSDIIINNLDKKNCLVNYRIYSENYKDLDLSKLNRDMSKTVFICHEDEFLGAPKENIIKLKEFNGDEKDKEFIRLNEEFKKIENDKIEDIRTTIGIIQSNFINKEMHK